MWLVEEAGVVSGLFYFFVGVDLVVIVNLNVMELPLVE